MTTPINPFTSKPLRPRLFHAAFDGDRQLTAWDTRKDKTYSLVRKLFGLNRKRKGVRHVPTPPANPAARLSSVTIQSKHFFEK